MTILEETPGAMAVTLTRTLPGGCLIEFEHAPVGWLAKNGVPRKREWRAYYLTFAGKRARVESVTTICDAILPKGGLPPWAERQGIRGALAAERLGLLYPGMTDDDAVQIVRRNQLGADAARDAAADRGLNVHAILEVYMREGRAPDPADHPEAHRPFVRGLVKWLLYADPEPVAVELLVGDPERGYAGRADLIAAVNGRVTLVDLKTQENGGIYESAHVQARLYRDAERRFGVWNIADARVVVVDGHGGFREMELIADEKLSAAALDYYRLVKPLCSQCDSANRAVRQALREAA